jgi:hypothetical protein
MSSSSVKFDQVGPTKSALRCPRGHRLRQGGLSRGPNSLLAAEFHQLASAAGGVVGWAWVAVIYGDLEFRDRHDESPSAGMCSLSQVGLSVCHELPRTPDSA